MSFTQRPFAGSERRLDTAGGIEWPVKRPLFGLGVSATTYEELTEIIIRAAHEHRPACVGALAVHGLMTATREPRFHEMLQQFDALAPDGQPIRFALNVLHHAGLADRVRGPDLALRVCERAAREGIPIYLFGSSDDVVGALRHALQLRFPDIRIGGSEPGVYGPIEPTEDQALVDRINRSGAGIVLVGLGCPRQEMFAARHKATIGAVQLCVGAAFDIIAGKKASAPLWMQRAGLEWLFRVAQEPRRLWRRYLFTNSRFTARLIVELIKRYLNQSRRGFRIVA